MRIVLVSRIGFFFLVGLLLSDPLSPAAAQQAGVSLNARARPAAPAPGAVFNLGDARKLFLSALPPLPVQGFSAPARTTGRIPAPSNEPLAARSATGAAHLAGLGAVSAEPRSGDQIRALEQTSPRAAVPAVTPDNTQFAVFSDSGAAPLDPISPGIEDSDVEVEDLSDEDLEELFDETEGSEDIDPLEPVNRVIFDVNLTLDRWLLRPVTRAYIETVPEPGRDGLSKMLDNVASPVTLANDLLQGEMGRAGTTFGRFFINSVFGLGGFFDTAEALGLPGHREDFGQTLGSYGVGGAPYLVLPIIGPSSPRDVTGRAVDFVFDPVNFVAPDGLQSVQTGVSLVNDRAVIIEETDSLEATAVDFYAAIRSFYYQNRDFEIRNGQPEQRLAADGESAAEEIDLDLYDELEEDSDPDQSPTD